MTDLSPEIKCGIFHLWYLIGTQQILYFGNILGPGIRNALNLSQLMGFLNACFVEEETEAQRS